MWWKKGLLLSILLAFWLYPDTAFAGSGPVRPSDSKGGMAKKARVAIVIDDFGMHDAEVVIEEMFSLGVPLTCAVMPNLENTYRHSVEAVIKGHQVIVHLPMEPLNGKRSWLGPGAITRNLTEEEIKNITRKDFESVPYAVGFNNHMGSAVTTQPRIMKPVLEVAKEKDFFVLDSRTSGETVIPDLSNEIGLRWAQRTVFLDNAKDQDSIEKKLKLLGQEAVKNGSAVGIGHVGLGHMATAKALKKMIPEMKAMGVEFVYLSDVLNQPVVQTGH